VITMDKRLVAGRATKNCLATSHYPSPRGERGDVHPYNPPPQTNTNSDKKWRNSS